MFRRIAGIATLAVALAVAATAPLHAQDQKGTLVFAVESLGAQTLVFFVLRIDAIDLLQLKRGDLDARPLLTLTQLRAIQRGLGVSPGTEVRVNFARELVVARKRVEKSDMLGWIEERLVFVLSMELDEA